MSLSEAAAFYNVLDQRILATMYESQAESFTHRMKARETDNDKSKDLEWVRSTRDAFFKQLQENGGPEVAAAVERTHNLRGVHSALAFAENRK